MPQKLYKFYYSNPIILCEARRKLLNKSETSNDRLGLKACENRKLCK